VNIRVWDIVSGNLRRATDRCRPLVPVVCFFVLARQFNLSANMFVRTVLELNVFLVGLWCLTFLAEGLVGSLRGLVESLLDIKGTLKEV